MSFKITVDDSRAQATINEAQRKVRDASPLMRALAGIMKDAVESNFAAQGRPKWVDLSPRTKAARARKGHWPGRILQVSGQLASSIHANTDATSASVGTNVAYAAIQQSGGTIRQNARVAHLFFKKYKSGKRKGKQLFAKESKADRGMKVEHQARDIRIPARPFLQLADSDIEKIRAKALQYLGGK